MTKEGNRIELGIVVNVKNHQVVTSYMRTKVRLPEHPF